ncbi:lipoprotein [Streptomyces thermolineatus]|uniref:Lipoprotein n=1 Tax=Streptomyces thermolineatus TaxID=44033 RepID=A0ABN3LUF6_9ACTN
MSRSLRRGALAAALALAAAAPLSACAAGNDAETLQVKPDNAATTVGDIKIQNAVVITTDEGAGPTAVSANVFNDGTKDQTIESITVDGAGAPVELSPAGGGGKVVVPAGGSLVLGGKGNASATLAKDSGVTTGDYQKVVFRFSDEGEVAIEAHVVSPHGTYASFGPSSEASAPSGSSSPSAKPSEPAEKGTASPAAAEKSPAAGEEEPPAGH